jgi:hypothetical protein
VSGGKGGVRGNGRPSTRSPVRGRPTTLPAAQPAEPAAQSNGPGRYKSPQLIHPYILCGISPDSRCSLLSFRHGCPWRYRGIRALKFLRCSE